MLSHRLEDDEVAKAESIHLVGIAARSLQEGVSPLVQPGNAAWVSHET